jgi:hypothetical protein
VVLSHHIPIYDKIFNLPGFLRDPALTFGFQDIVFHERVKSALAEKRSKKEGLTLYSKMRQVLQTTTQKEFFDFYVPWQFIESALCNILKNFGLECIHSLDLFDRRADLSHDMNLPAPESFKNRFATIIDIGCLEHVFDTRQCLHNLFKMLMLGGRLMLHTPCCGYFDHGFFTFNPESIIETLKVNGFDIEFLTFSLEPEGFQLEKPIRGEDVLLWCMARKVREQQEFVIPQQNGCREMYGLTTTS